MAEAEIKVEQAAEAVAQADKQLKLLDKAVIKTDQDGIKATQSGLDKRIHDNAIQCMMHAKQFGDASLMRRLLVDVLDRRNTGYRVQGLINWMRKHSPMELNGNTVNLTGTDGKGNKREWKIEEANARPFWTDRNNDERVAKPVFRDTLVGSIDRAYKQFMEAFNNTKDGQPIDPTKAYYDGIQTDKVLNFFEQVKKLRDDLPVDATADVRKAQAEQRRLAEFIAGNKNTVNQPPATGELEALAPTPQTTVAA
jgi:hypothetical protein